MKYQVQVPKEHYYKGYDSLSRFSSYYYQIETAISVNPKKILEIGVGNKTVSNYLKERGLDVKTFDFDKELNPDIVGDMRDMYMIKDKSYDLVMACEVLEHLPWEEIDKALKELNRVSSKYVIVAMPWSGWSFNINITFPYIKKIFKRDYFNFGFVIPRFYANVKWRGEHYWEIGSKDFPLSNVRKKLRKYFILENDFQNPLNRYHHYFVLKKK
jgi:ubiquinone/menaquinone biosynthesis C-methylase UbiE